MGINNGATPQGARVSIPSTIPAGAEGAGLAGNGREV